MQTEHRFIANRYTRFLAKVEANGFNPSKCWPWQGAGKGNGYGNVREGGVNETAHRVAYRLFCGEVPEGAEVMHTCDNRWCVNPDHLVLGTRSDNMADCKSKGRTSGGVRKHLTEKTVQEIVRRLKAGHSRRRVADQMDVNYSTVSSIARGESYGK